MKKLILALCLLLMVSVGAAGEEMQTETAPTVAEIALTMRPESEEPTHLTVGNSTKVSGSFFTTQFGNNTSDIDVRYMLHGYNPIVWMNQLEFTTDPMVVDSLESADTRAGRTYTIRIVDGLTYNDGVTPVTAEDYVFSYLLLTSPQFAVLGANTGAYAHVVGYEAFSAGETDVFSGVRLIDERTFSVTVKAQYEPYFYELSYLAVYPYPIGVIAPGCEVRDDGEGAYIANIDETAVEPVFTAELLQSTVLDAENGYLSHPYLTCGPYKLVSYDRESGTVEFAINEFYVGNYEGVRPVIDTVTLVPVLPQDMKEKLESGEITLAHEPLDLNRLLRDILTIVEQRAAEAGVALEYDRRQFERMKLDCVYGSPLHLRQVFLNVYGNCIKYNKVGGSVTTLCQNVSERDGIVTYRWVIRDTGIGMSRAFLAHIFDPFAQEHTDARSVYHGTGLGMAIVKSLIDKMGGSIEVSSREGEGSEFVITLPFEIAEELPEPQQAAWETEAADVRGLRILLAEDNALNAEIVKKLLADRGAEVEAASDGRQALEAFESHKPGTYAAILMDVMMPNMDGLDATRAIRALDRADAKVIPIIAMTANAFEEDARKCMEAGMNAHLPKPIRIERLVAVIAGFCGARQA